jgi:putative nucleotidyltransferase with HDIG domain
MTQAPAQRPTWSRGVQLYVCAVAVVAVVAVVISIVKPPHSWERDQWVAFGVLLALGLVSVAVREPDVGSKVTFSFLSIIVISSVVLTGPAGSAIIGGLSMALERGRRPLIARLFNASMFALQGLVGGLVYVGLQGPIAEDVKTISGAGELLLRVGVPLVIADVAQMLVNAVLLAGVVRLSTGMPFRRFITQIVSSSGPAYIGYGVIGFLLIVLWLPADVGPFSAVLILAPLYVARWAFVQFGEEQRAHERTLSALVTAVETKDPNAAGHSGRIATLAEWMARPLSMGAQDVQSLRYAAMLHDVGKVGVPTRILRRPRELTSADLEALTHHSALGVVLVREIDFLRGSLDGIRHHHERWDGLGYPDGLVGDEIPLVSRVIAVADAFDALTGHVGDSDPDVRDAANAELVRYAGSHFDPAVVRAWLRAPELEPAGC